MERKNIFISKQFQYKLSLISLLIISIISILLLLRNLNKEKEEKTKLFQNLYLQKAILLSELIQDKEADSEDAILSELMNYWNDLPGKLDDEYVCIVDSSAKLILHTRFPQTVNSFAGNNLVFDQGTGKNKTLLDLCKSKINYLGEYISSSGEEQVAAFIYIPQENWTLGVHRSSDQLTKEVKHSMENYLILMFFIFIVFIPIVAFFMYRLFVKISFGKSEAEYGLKKSESQFQNLFHNSAIPIWEEDFSELKKYFDSLKIKGVKNFEDYFNSNPKEVSYCASLIKTIRVNKTSLSFFGINDSDDLRHSITHFFNDKSLQVFKQELIILANGETEFTSEIEIIDLEGKIRQLLLKLVVNPDSINTLSSILVSFIDITQRVQAETELIEHRNNLEKLIKKRTIELEEKNKELENFNQLFVGREFRIKELKDKVKELEERLNN